MVLLAVFQILLETFVSLSYCLEQVLHMTHRIQPYLDGFRLSAHLNLCSLHAHYSKQTGESDTELRYYIHDKIERKIPLKRSIVISTDVAALQIYACNKLKNVTINTIPK